MEINAANARKRAGETFDFSCEAEVGRTEYGGRQLVFAEPVRVAGSYVYDGKAFTVSGEVRTCFASVCARCNERFDEPFVCTFTERFAKSAESDDGTDVYPFEGDTISITDAVMDNLFLNLPLVNLCSGDCRGLCPVCGANRNVTDCACRKAEPRGPFSELAALGIEYKEV